MTEHITFFIYGLCVMFYSMMVWMFYRKNKEKLSRLITCLMAILDMECLKDLLLFVDGIRCAIDYLVSDECYRYGHHTFLHVRLDGVGEARMAYLGQRHFA